MVQFRKSKTFGPVRITVSKKGIGGSIGAGPVRVGIGADGKVRRTIRVPRTGIYDTKVVGQTGTHSKPKTITRARTAGTSVPTVETQLERRPVELRDIKPVVLQEPIIARGYHSAVTFDGWWITIKRTGIKHSTERIPLDHLKRVTWKQPSLIVNGYLQFVVVGDDQPPEGFPAVYGDPNAVVMRKYQVGRFELLRAMLSEALSGGRDDDHAPPATDSAGSVVEPVGAMGAAGTTPPPTAPPNWYPDPVNAGIVRWWNGTRWTEHIQPRR